MAMRKLGVDPEEPNNRAHADRILEYKMDTDPLSVLPQEILHAIESLWHDPVIPSVMDRSSEFYLMDSATYFFANIRKIGAVDYVPDEADVLRARTKTTGISETRFNMGQLSIHMFDVGGQRSERKKWIHCECGWLVLLARVIGPYPGSESGWGMSGKDLGNGRARWKKWRMVGEHDGLQDLPPFSVQFLKAHEQCSLH